MRYLPDSEYYFLVTAGPCGSLLLHSLFDGHPEVLTVPTFFNYYAFYERNYRLPPHKMCERLIRAVPITDLFFKRSTLRSGNFTNLPLERDVFCEAFINYLNQKGISSRNFIEAVHYAYAKGIDQDLSRVKVIFVHNHYSKPIPKILEDFPDARFMVTIRNPKATLYSYYKRITQLCGGRVPSHLILTKIHSMIITWERYSNWLKPQKKHFIVRLEDMHTNLKGVADYFVQKMCITPSDQLYESTLGGAPYICTTPSNKNIQGASARMVEPLYKKEMPVVFEEFIETLFAEIFAECRYDSECLNKMTYNEVMEFRFKNEVLFNPVKDFRSWHESLNYIHKLLHDRPWYKTATQFHLAKVIQFLFAIKAYPEHLRQISIQNLHFSLPWERKKLLLRALVSNPHKVDLN